MPRALPLFFDQHSEPLDRRIATGLHKLGLAMKQQSWVMAAADGLSPTQGQILAALSLEGALTGSELAGRLGLTLPTVSDAVKALVEKAYATKRPDPRHARASLIELTETGRALAAKVRSWPDFLASAAATLSTAEQAAFLSGLVKMIRSLQENGQIPVNRMCVTCKFFRPHVHTEPTPHHCSFVDAPMASHHLRLDCAEHEQAAPAVLSAHWKQFVASD